MSQPEEKNAKQKVPKTYEAAVAELEDLVANMESGQLPLEESLKTYQRGVFLVKYCQDQLGHVQQQVSLVEKGLASATNVVDEL